MKSLHSARTNLQTDKGTELNGASPNGVRPCSVCHMALIPYGGRDKWHLAHLAAATFGICPIWHLVQMACPIWHLDQMACNPNGTWTIWHVDHLACGPFGMWSIWHLTTGMWTNGTYIQSGTLRKALGKRNWFASRVLLTNDVLTTKYLKNTQNCIKFFKIQSCTLQRALDKRIWFASRVLLTHEVLTTKYLKNT